MANDKEGFYSISYAGWFGWGFGMVVLDTGQVVGADLSGGVYDGEYIYNPRSGLLDCKIRMTVPAGVPLVTGKAPQTQPYSIEFSASLPTDLGSQTPVSVQLPTGPVNVIFRKIRDLPG